MQLPTHNLLFLPMSLYCILRSDRLNYCACLVTKKKFLFCSGWQLETAERPPCYALQILYEAWKNTNIVFTMNQPINQPTNQPTNLTTQIRSKTSYFSSVY